MNQHPALNVVSLNTEIVDVIGEYNFSELVEFTKRPHGLYESLRDEFGYWLETAPPSVIEWMREVAGNILCDDPISLEFDGLDYLYDNYNGVDYEYIADLRFLRSEIENNWGIHNFVNALQFYYFIYLLEEIDCGKLTWEIPKRIRIILDYMKSSGEYNNGIIIDAVELYLQKLLYEFCECIS